MKTIFIESDLASFADFHDGEWFAQLFSGVNGSDIEAAVEDFAAHWWGASRSFVLPWLYVTGVYDAINSTVPIIGKSKQDLWDEFLEVNAFKTSLWKIAEGAFCAIYYAYENLLVRMLVELHGSPIRVTDRDFTKELIKVYGQSMVSRIWTGNQISMAREVRNCITHNSGKASARLLSMRPRPRVESGDVLISASDVRVLYTRLKPIANEAINESVHRINARRY